MKKLPIPKKSVKNFLTEEDGKMTKENLLKIGGFLTAVGLATISQSQQANAHESQYPNCLSEDSDTDVGINLLPGQPEGYQHVHTIDHVAEQHQNEFRFNVLNPNTLSIGASHTNYLPPINSASDHSEHCQHANEHTAGWWL